MSAIELRVHFLTGYLAPWVHRFCQSIQIGTNNLFYTNLAECLETVIGQTAELEIIGLTENNLPPKKNALQPAV